MKSNESFSEQDRKHFLQIVNEHLGLINGVCRMYSPVEEDFKDLQQEVILQLWESLPSFRQESKISTWIYRIAFNTILSKRRDNKKYSTNVSLSEFHDELAQAKPFDDEVQQLLFIISQLENNDKAIVMLYLEGYSHKEIADVLSMSVTNISTRMNRIKSRLKEIYNVKQHEPGKI